MHKNFFKFFIFSFAFILIFTLSEKAHADTSNISKISIITPEQTIKPNEVSKEITIQLQDASGNKVSALETIRFDAFQSTSPTGIFVSCTTPTNPPTDYLAKNGSNKNICYRDSTEGTYTITVKTSNTANILTTSQVITVSSGSSSSGSGNGDIGGSSTSTATTTALSATATSSSQTNSAYVYSSSVSISSYELLDLSVEAGRERIAFLHSPIEFKSRALDRVTKKGIYGARFTWTFGDGTSAEGEAVYHTYVFPGDYNVVLNSYSGSDEAVDVTKVKVVEANVAGVYTGSYLELENKGATDVNVGGWKVRSKEGEYILPCDTIISVQERIKIPRGALGKAGVNDSISVFYPDNQLVSVVSSSGSVNQIQTAGDFKERLIRELAKNAQPPVSGTVAAEGESGSRLVSENDVRKGEEGRREEDSNVAASLETPAARSIISKILDFFGMMWR